MAAPASSAPAPELVDDPGVVLQHYAAGKGVTFAEACRALPTIAAYYHRGEHLPPAARQQTQQMVTPAGRRHFSSLSETERRRWLPPRSVRRLRPDERPDPCETAFQVFGPDGGLFAEVTG